MVEIKSPENLEGTETAKNLLKSFAGESQARNRYTFFASKAKKEGYKQIEAIFLETAKNEKEHAEVFFKHLNNLNEPLNIEATYPAGKIGTTKENLLAAAEGEKEEWSVLYKNFKEIAEKEGFPEVAKSFQEISEVEEQHEARYRKLLENVKKEEVFKRPGKPETKWKCINCGYVHEGEEAPEECPACRHKKEYYQILEENY